MKPEDSIISSSRIEPISIRKAYLIDGHPLFLDGYNLLLGALCPPPHEIIYINTLSQIEPETIENHNRDIALLDLYSVGQAGIELLIDLRISAPDLKLIIVTDSDDEFLIDWCLALGVAGFIPKSTNKHIMLRAIRRISAGEKWTPKSHSLLQEEDRLSSPPQNTMHLTQKEITTLKYLVLGMVNRDIAEKMNVTESTTKSHVSSIIKKLGVINRTQVFTEFQRISNPDNKFMITRKCKQHRQSENA